MDHEGRKNTHDWLSNTRHLSKAGTSRGHSLQVRGVTNSHQATRVSTLALVQAETKPPRMGTDLHLLRAEPEFHYRRGMKILKKVLSLISFKFKVLPGGQDPGDCQEHTGTPCGRLHFHTGVQCTLQRRERGEQASLRINMKQKSRRK